MELILSFLSIRIYISNYLNFHIYLSIYQEQGEEGVETAVVHYRDDETMYVEAKAGEHIPYHPPPSPPVWWKKLPFN